MLYDQRPTLLHAFDNYLPMQTEEEIDRVCTTGKLFLYLAAGRFVLASRAGEKARVLPEEVFVDFSGKHNPSHQTHIATRPIALLTTGIAFNQHAA